jgi:AcrR family transcriptional regulator
MAEQNSQSGTVRERFRSYLTSEAKRVAVRQLADGGPAAVSLNAIGKELGMSGPALYRYFDSRDALMTELIRDAYRDLTDALKAATTSTPRRPAAALATAYRAWAIEQPHRYRLLFAAPMLGYDAHQAQLVGQAQAAMNVLLAALSVAPTPTSRAIPAKLRKQLAAWATARGAPGAAPPEVALQALHIWTRMHGHVRLELDGNFASMGLDPRLLFETSLPEIFISPTRGKENWPTPTESAAR